MLKSASLKSLDVCDPRCSPLLFVDDNYVVMLRLIDHLGRMCRQNYLLICCLEEMKKSVLQIWVQVNFRLVYNQNVCIC